MLCLPDIPRQLHARAALGRCDGEMLCVQDCVWCRLCVCRTVCARLCVCAGLCVVWGYVVCAGLCVCRAVCLQAVCRTVYVWLCVQGCVVQGCVVQSCVCTCVYYMRSQHSKEGNLKEGGGS